MRNDVDYVPMATWKVFLIQLLNIAGTGQAGLLAMLTAESLDSTFWMWAVMVYYMVATDFLFEACQKCIKEYRIR
jgi:carbon starvation protein CstA